MDYITNKIAERLGGSNFGKDTKIYKFAMIKNAKEKAKIMNPNTTMIDMGVGEPDMPADKAIVEVLANEAGKPENRFYADNGIPEFYKAAAQYMEKVYGVKGLDPESQFMHGIGSKPVLAMLPACFINPGDITLATVPGYPVMSTWTKYLGGEVYNLPLTEENDFYPDLENIPKDILKKAKLLYVNYPNNPTGQVASKEFYEKVVKFAKTNEIIVIADSAYAHLTYDGEKPLSFLSIEGAIDVGIELHSLSKAFNMTGWRMAFAVGNSKIIKAYSTVKDNYDSGQFRAIQKAGIYAMMHPEITEKIGEKYSRRFELLVKTLNQIGFAAVKPKGSFFLYVKCPKGAGKEIVFQNAEEASKFLIENASISVVPWDDAGAYLRFSVTFEAFGIEEEKRIMDELKNRLKGLDLVF